MTTTGAVRLVGWIEENGRAFRRWMAPLILVMILAVYVLVYATGGIKFVFSHSMYLPILLAGLVFGLRGGLLAGLLGGLVLGPAMPIDTVTGEMQQTINWLYRTGFFALIGILSGVASDGVREYMSHLGWLARQDQRTGLPNRLALREDLARQLASGAEDRGFQALVVVSLDNAKELDAAFGTDLTEDLARQVAARCRQSDSLVDKVYSLSLKEEAFLVSAPSADELSGKLRELLEQFKQPFQYRGISVHGDISLAEVPLVDRDMDAEVCLRRAEAALLAGREKGHRLSIYSDEIDNDISDNIHLLGELKVALESGQLLMHYQPKVRANGRVDSVEALMRWQHPKMGNIPPGKFIPRAEKSTLINQLTDFAIDSALAQQARWRTQGMDLVVAVNVSAENLMDPKFVNRVLEMLSRHGVPGHRLELEITEGSFIYDIGHTIRELTRLAGAKISIAIDDFGTGYSSLKYLYDLPASVIKVDQSFIRTLPDDQGAASIVETATGLAARLGLEVVAEGVETLGAYEYLREIGCDVLQGYYISRPVAADDLSDWYQRLSEPGLWTPRDVSGPLAH